MDYRLMCVLCRTKYGADYAGFRCARCGSILEVAYKYDGKLVLYGSKITHKKYRSLFPVSGRLYSLGEGGTPLKKYKTGGGDIFLKLETKNPTNSFKDRGSSVEITKAKELGFKEVCCASTGNMGISTATYAARFGLKCTIFISKDADAKKISLIKKAGAEIVELAGDFNKALETAERFSKVNKVFLCGDYHYRKEGQKSVMYEIVDQLDGAPDAIILPVGNSTLLAAVYKALAEFKMFGKITKMPKLIGVQAEGCDPLVRAYRNKKRIKYTKPHTDADAIAVGYPTFGFEGLIALKATKGIALSVDDREIEDARVRLADDGISAEPGGAAAFAGALKLQKKGTATLKWKDTVCLVTGNN